MHMCGSVSFPQGSKHFSLSVWRGEIVLKGLGGLYSLDQDHSDCVVYLAACPSSGMRQVCLLTSVPQFHFPWGSIHVPCLLSVSQPTVWEITALRYVKAKESAMHNRSFLQYRQPSVSVEVLFPESLQMPKSMDVWLCRFGPSLNLWTQLELCSSCIRRVFWGLKKKFPENSSGLHSRPRGRTWSSGLQKASQMHPELSSCHILEVFKWAPLWVWHLPILKSENTKPTDNTGHCTRTNLDAIPDTL